MKKNKYLYNNTVPDNISFETFKKLDSYQISNLYNDNPSCFNGNVSIRKYKYTIELIDESNEILAQRLQDLWDECDNSHYYSPLKKAADEIGYKFKNLPGSKIKK